MSRPLLSLCMIVRDEEAMLPGLLASVDGLWDELVVADTGSVDGTIGILEAAGARVVHHRWRSDFAAARNASLAPAEGRWILCLDADERVSPALAAQIRHLLVDEGAGAATLVMRNSFPGGNRRDADLLRLFRNDPAIRFEHAIHEDPSDGVRAYLERTGLALRRLSGVAEHLGYVREVAALRDKKARDLGILQDLVARNPGDLYSWFKILELARFWDDEDLLGTTAVGAAGALLAAAPGALSGRTWSGDLAAMIARGLHPAPADALAWLEAHAERVAPTAAWHLARGRWLESLGRDAEAAAAYTASLEADDDATSGLRVRPRLGLARLAAASGRLPEARDLALAAADAAPADAEALLAAAGFCRLAGGDDAVDAFVVRRRRLSPEADEDLAQALLAAGEARRAQAILAELADAVPTCALGLLTCSLVTGLPVDLTIDLDRETADEAFRRWILVVWNSRRTEAMTALAERAGTVSGAFPWLPEFLAAETRRLAGR